MAKKDELEFEGGVESSTPKPNNSEIPSDPIAQ